jgi:hypothetical protein
MVESPISLSSWIAAMGTSYSMAMSSKVSPGWMMCSTRAGSGGGGFVGFGDGAGGVGVMWIYEGVCVGEAAIAAVAKVVGVSGPSTTPVAQEASRRSGRQRAAKIVRETVSLLTCTAECQNT